MTKQRYLHVAVTEGDVGMVVFLFCKGTHGVDELQGCSKVFEFPFTRQRSPNDGPSSTTCQANDGVVRAAIVYQPAVAILLLCQNTSFPTFHFFSTYRKKKPMEAWKQVIHDNELETRRTFNRALTAGGTISFDTVIAGGGVAGLFCAWTLKKTFPSQTVCVLDRRTHLGGRVRTSKLADGTILENGPWRVHESHKHALRMIQDLGLTIETNASSHDEPAEDSGENDLSGLSTFDNDTFAAGAETARAKDVMSGYEGINDADSKANVYHGQRHKSGTYYFVKEGFMEIISRLEKQCRELGVDVRSNHMVIDVSRIGDQYKVDILENKTYDNKSRPAVVFGSRFVAAIPAPGGLEKLHRALEATLGLRQIPAAAPYLRPGKEQHHHNGDPPDARGAFAGNRGRYQGPVLSNFLQCRSNGRLLAATALEPPQEVRGETQSRVSQTVPKCGIVGQHPCLLLAARGPHVEARFRECQYIGAHGRCCDRAPPVKLPQFYFIGEACSGNQGWIEGSLETAVRPYRACNRRRRSNTGPRRTTITWSTTVGTLTCRRSSMFTLDRRH